MTLLASFIIIRSHVITSSFMAIIISVDVTFTFDQPMYVVTEGSESATVCVNKNGGSAITLQIEITGGM